MFYDIILYHYGDISALPVTAVFGLNNIADSAVFVKPFGKYKNVTFPEPVVPVATNIKKE